MKGKMTYEGFTTFREFDNETSYDILNLFKKKDYAGIKTFKKAK